MRLGVLAFIACCFMSFNLMADDFITISGNSVLVNDNVQNLKLSDLVNVAQNADEISIGNNVWLVLDNDFIPGAFSNTLTLNGDCYLKISDLTNFQDTVLFWVDNAANLHLYQEAQDENIYSVRMVSESGAVRLLGIRVTDYENLLSYNNDVGGDLNLLREKDADDKLFSVLDSLDNINDFNEIINKSVHFNPILLMNMVGVLDNFQLNKNKFILNESDLWIAPEYIFGDKMSALGVNVGTRVLHTDNFYLGLSGYYYNANWADNINKFSGNTFGGNLDAFYKISDLFFVSSKIGASYTKFDSGYVFDDEKIFENPYGVSLYYGVDFGASFDVNDNLSVVPFVGLYDDYVYIVNKSDDNFAVKTGANAKYKFSFDNMLYKYSAYFAVDTNAEINAGVSVDVWSELDGAGGTISAEVYNSDFGMQYKITGKLNIVF